ncbi:B-cell receptor CD22-like isoform X2 [Mugil cephalus]|uniref:B-cell receptor CD22-like isoform X2 n=1 Tax=Mugil cephalus TaxID=48193 RepID=UPI001FB61CA3|nr:B-cell receptor CD22-like isoform X2 [Mugil cephalus]
MGLTAAMRGFFVFLLSVSVVLGQTGYGVTYSSTQICAVKGSTVEIKSSFTYPYKVGRRSTTVEKTFWFTGSEPDDLSTDSKYSGRVTHSCNENKCTLRISDLRESDSAEYKFIFITNQEGGRFTGSPGVTLTVSVLHVEAKKTSPILYPDWAEVKCQSRCRLSARSYVWYKNGLNMNKDTYSVQQDFSPGDTVSCAFSGHEDYRSPSVYAPKLPSVSVSPSGEIVEGSSGTLTCSSDANPAANYTWYKTQTLVSNGPQLVLSSVQPSVSGEYQCTAENTMGKMSSRYITIDVKYAPKLPSVSVSPSGEIVEGSSGTLTCSSDANPAANYTWYKENQILSQGSDGVHAFISISSNNSGNYYCKSENQYGYSKSSSLFIDVQYPPKLPSVSVSPSGEIVEGSSGTLTCSSDANPAANYTWYKENEDSPKASGQIFTITDFRPEHRGSYYCEAQNRRGRHNSTLHLVGVTDLFSSVVLFLGFHPGRRNSSAVGLNPMNLWRL